VQNQRRPTAAPTAAAVGIAAYVAALLLVDRSATYSQQLALGALTWLVLGAALTAVSPFRRTVTLGVVAFATIGEVTGSLIWGVYSYRLHNLPLFIPPAHGLVYLAGLAVARATGRRAATLVVVAATAAATWCVLGLAVLPGRDLAGAAGVPLLMLFLWRSRNRAVYAGVFCVVACLELYGTAIGTWRWASELPGLGVPDGNPPSGAAAGYVWFDVMALGVFVPLVTRCRAAFLRWPLSRSSRLRQRARSGAPGSAHALPALESHRSRAA
jgi:hypothetical protein